MKPTVVDHIGIAVKSIDDALAFWQSALGVKCTGVEEVEEQKVKTAFLPIGDTEVELLEATSDESPVAKFIEKKGEGIHHLAIRVENLEAALAELRKRASGLLTKRPGTEPEVRRSRLCTPSPPEAFCWKSVKGRCGTCHTG